MEHETCSIMFYPIPLKCLLHGGLYSNPHSTRWLITYNSNFHNPPTNKGIPSGKPTKNDGKSQFLMGKYTISMVIFNSYAKLAEGTIDHT